MRTCRVQRRAFFFLFIVSCKISMTHITMFPIRHNTDFMARGNPFVTRTEFKHTLLYCVCVCVIHRVLCMCTYTLIRGPIFRTYFYVFPYYNSHNTAITTVNYTFSALCLVSFCRTFKSDNQHPS